MQPYRCDPAIPLSQQEDLASPLNCRINCSKVCCQLNKILLFLDSNITNDKLVLDYPEYRTVFTYPDPLAWLVGRAPLYFFYILTMKRMSSILLEGDLNSDPCLLR